VTEVRFVPLSTLRRARTIAGKSYEALQLLADLCRINTLSAVKLAGSGHLGSSFSAMDIVAWLYFREMNVLEIGINNPNRDIYFSSKGHDVPGLYAVLVAAEILPESQLRKLRRLGGLDGHPEVHIPGIEFNTGSLGMGISKGRGAAWAKRHLGRNGRVFVLTGDGELQEGQNYEALQGAAHHGLDELHVIVDHNKLQTDKAVSAIVDLGDLETKFRAFGWNVRRCDGHDFRSIDTAFRGLRELAGPKAIIADTVKGSGVSFMEPQSELVSGDGIYRWHSGAPDDQSYSAALSELLDRAQHLAGSLGVGSIDLETVTAPPSGLASQQREYVADAYGTALVQAARSRRDIIVLDGDLAADCRVRAFELEFPDRFIENGIAEQDMVSMAGGLARSGLLPVVNSFASFLAARANEQIYNNATERTKIIYACHYAGIIPAGPGKSHQSVRDISLFGALPNVIVIQPCNSAETAAAVDYCVNVAEESCVLRLAIGPSPRAIALPQGYSLAVGRGVTIRHGGDAVLFAYGPVMLHEALTASEMLEERGFGLAVVNRPWLNRVDVSWLTSLLQDYRRAYVIEDHAATGGLGDRLLSALAAVDLSHDMVQKIGITDFPACGTPDQVLRFHGLDGASIAATIGGSEEDLAAPVRHQQRYTAEAPQ
jgi:transketolase